MSHLSFDEVSRQRTAAERAVTRRSVLKGAGGLAALGMFGSVLAACGGDGSSAAAGGGGGGGGTLREVGLSLTEDPRIFGPAQKELGIKIQGKSDNLGNQITFWNQNAKQFDTNQLNFNQLGGIEEHISPIKVSEIPSWNDQVPALFREPDQPGASKTSGWPLAGIYTKQALDAKTYDEFRAVPTWFGFDAFGYIEGKAQGDTTSYGSIFDPGNKGRATLLNEPITSVLKVASYLEGSKQASFKGPLNNLTKDDLQTVFAFLKEHKAKGQFRIFWSDFGQLVDLLTAGEVWVGDFWASAVAAAAQGGAKAKFVDNPKEGSNAWIQGVAISNTSKNRAAALKYIDWNLRSGVTGAILGTQGYYSPRPDTAKTQLAKQKAPSGSGDAYGYYYEGAGDRPSLEDRLKHIADWQSYPDEFQEYSRLWTDFTAA
jgi:spermidine/putrescine-binding protein